MRFEYFNYATGYYATGRFALYAGAQPLAGNLFHHAVEMFLKGCLVARTTEQERKTKLGHKLDKLWEKFRETAIDPALDAFKPLVEGLNAFEDIRYPEELLRNGATISMGVGPTLSAGVLGSPVFSLDIDKLDELVIALHKVGSVNPKAVRLGLEGKKYLSMHNKFAHEWAL